MRAPVSIYRRTCLPIGIGLTVFQVAATCLAVVGFDLPNVTVPVATSGPTTGSFNVLVTATGADVGRMIGSYNLDFVVGGGNFVTLGPPSIPTSNALLSDPGPPESPFFKSFLPNGQGIRVAHDVPVDQPLANGKALVTVPFSVPAGVTGTFPLTFGPATNNLLVEGTATQIPVNLSDVGQITIMAAPVGVPGDYNNNGVVDAADYVVWRDRRGTATTLPNEVSGITPGMVTDEDYTAWRARFGRTSGSGAVAALSAAAVPEPMSLVLSAFVVLVPASLARGRRKVTRCA